jgi:HD-GYP domain-containing protein (c-di-GMP phosphodiesterase class II)
MRRSTSDRLVPVVAVGGALAAFPIAAGHFVGRNPVMFGGDLHFVGVGLSALAASAAAVVLTVLGAQRRDSRTVLIGTAFSVMAALLALHGLATPGILVGSNGVVAFTGGITIPVGGAILALSALPRMRRAASVTPLIGLQIALLLGVFGLGISALLAPSLVPSVPEAGSPPAIALMLVGLAFYALLAFRAFRTFLLTRRHADLLVAVGIVWFAAALPPAMLLSYMELGWWLGHAFELLGLLIVGIPVAFDLRRAVQSRPLNGDLTACELVLAEEAFLGGHVRSLMVSLAEKDASTAEHTRRVAYRAVQVGHELGLSPHRLRELATGALVHDIGKLRVPDAILKKPGALTDEEFAVVRRHAEWGRRALADLGFSEATRRLVLDHHERLDGSGYPNGLHGLAISLDARILAVCDVYDALISTRVYRGAFSHEQALAILREEADTKLDRRCVGALERVLAAERAPAAVAV